MIHCRWQSQPPQCLISKGMIPLETFKSQMQPPWELSLNSELLVPPHQVPEIGHGANTLRVVSLILPCISLYSHVFVRLCCVIMSLFYGIPLLAHLVCFFSSLSVQYVFCFVLSTTCSHACISILRRHLCATFVSSFCHGKSKGSHHLLKCIQGALW